MSTQFKKLLKNLENKENKEILEAINKAFDLIFESLSTDDANPKQSSTNDVYQSVGPSPTLPGKSQKTYLSGDPRLEIPHEEYFDNTLDKNKLLQVRRAQQGGKQMTIRPNAGRTSNTRDFITNQY